MKAFLIDLLGTDNVLTTPDGMREYREDYTEAEPGEPDLVCMPENAEQVQKIVVRANELKVPVTPRVYGTNVGGLTIPSNGGLVLDMTRMNRVLEVNVDDMYAVIEPGVTQQTAYRTKTIEDTSTTISSGSSSMWSPPSIISTPSEISSTARKS